MDKLILPILILLHILYVLMFPPLKYFQTIRIHGIVITIGILFLAVILRTKHKN